MLIVFRFISGLGIGAEIARVCADEGASVFLTECDPSRYRAGAVIDVEIVGAQGYDLIARP